MIEDAEVVDYAQPPPASGSAAPFVALVLVGVQVVWLYPGVLAGWVRCATTA
jgi:hypothetical protein